jgi:3-methyl-2-oxobutanoate hydroxymethyltransferase
LSAASRLQRLTPAHIGARKGGTPIVALTAYSTPIARLIDPHCDLILIGDSLGMVLYGMPTTLGVTLDMMINHGLAVMRGSARACVVVDLPFGSYGESPEQAFRSAARVMAESGCSAVKLEGGAAMAPTIAFLVARGIPVMAHIGLVPQSVHAMGGFRVQGRGEAESRRLLDDARAVQDAGAFSVVIEGTVEPVARAMTESLAIPTIGIGASAVCDGQILVTDDLIGMFADFTPTFVKRYAETGKAIEAAVAAYAGDVRTRHFPADAHTFKEKVEKP